MKNNFKYLALGLLIGFSIFNNYALFALIGFIIYQLVSKKLVNKNLKKPFDINNYKPSADKLADAILRKNPDLKSHIETN